MRSSSDVWDEWIIGALSKRQLNVLLTSRLVIGVAPSRIGASAIDVALDGHIAYRMKQGVVKPSGDGYHARILNDLDLAEAIVPDAEGVYRLDPRSTYVFKADLNVSGLRGKPFHGQATAKSSIGRMDVLARLIVDGASGYEGFSQEDLNHSNGEVFIEVTPLTFPVRVKSGTPLSQLRLFLGPPEASEVRSEVAFRSFVRGAEKASEYLSVDLSPESIGGHQVIGFRARTDGGRSTDPIDLWEGCEAHSEPWRYWEFVLEAGQERFTLEERRFYILRSKETLALPEGVAAYCRAIDETLGEMRIHYAGFVHPGFGRHRGDETTGTPLIFEVRGHDVSVVLRDGDRLARLTFYRMSEAAHEDSPYEKQTLKLSKFFIAWPPRADVSPTGVVTQTAEV